MEKDKLQVLGSDQRKWMDLKSKIYDFSQIKGDFVNLIQLKQYQRENIQ